MKSTLSYIQKNKKRFLEELFALIRIPSISADPAYADDMQKAAEKVEEKALPRNPHNHKHKLILQIALILQVTTFLQLNKFNNKLILILMD